MNILMLSLSCIWEMWVSDLGWNTDCPVVSCGFSQSFQVDARIVVPRLVHDYFLLDPFPIHQSSCNLMLQGLYDDNIVN